MMIGRLAALALLGLATAAPPAARPVRIGLAGDDLDACLSDGEVRGLNSRGDNFLAVRSAPAANAPMLGRLGPGHRVHVCEEAAGGQWLGVVYDPAPDGDRDCGVGSPVSRPQPYRGPCRAGWVSARYVEIVAG